MQMFIITVRRANVYMLLFRLCIQTVQMSERAETTVMCMYVQHLMEKLFILHAVYQEEMGSTPEKG